MTSVTEDVAFWTRGDELVLVLVAWGIAELEEAVPVESVGIGEDVGVFHEDRPHAYKCILGNGDVVAEGDVFFGLAVHVDCFC